MVSIYPIQFCSVKYVYWTIRISAKISHHNNVLVLFGPKPYPVETNICDQGTIERLAQNNF